jgi:2-phosphoglycerate kinase
MNDINQKRLGQAPRHGRAQSNTQGPSDGKSQVVISDIEPGLPYSKGLMASKVMVTGLSPLRSYQVAERVEEILSARGVASVTTSEINDLATDVLQELAGDRYAKNFVKWQEVERLDIPLVLLIGGATGVGKSTIATQIAARLGIVRVVATDAIREVMRALFSKELMPTLYTSSFDAGTALREPAPRGDDPVVVGFREQTAAVAVGLRAMLDRAAVEGLSLIVEGAHVVPGFLDGEPYRDRFLAVPVIVTVDEEEMHRTHFAVRSMDLASRPGDRYVKGFDNIRKVQKYIRSQALAHGVPIIRNYSLDQAITGVIDLVVQRAKEHAGSTRAPVKSNGAKKLGADEAASVAEARGRVRQ